jgi:hypothetical protein
VYPERRFRSGFTKLRSGVRTPNRPESLLKAALGGLDNGILPLGGLSGRFWRTSAYPSLSKRLAPILPALARKSPSKSLGQALAYCPLRLRKGEVCPAERFGARFPETVVACCAPRQPLARPRTASRRLDKQERVRTGYQGGSEEGGIIQAPGTHLRTLSPSAWHPSSILLLPHPSSPHPLPHLSLSVAVSSGSQAPETLALSYEVTRNAPPPTDESQATVVPATAFAQKQQST